EAVKADGARTLVRSKLQSSTAARSLVAVLPGRTLPRTKVRAPSAVADPARPRPPGQTCVDSFALWPSLSPSHDLLIVICGGGHWSVFFFFPIQSRK